MITGFTLPGMIEEPGCVSGRAISAIPARGPIASSRRSDPIFQSDRAIVRRPPWAAIAASIEAWAWKWFVVSRTSSPVRARRRATAPAG